MPIPQQVYQKNKRSPPKRRRRKQGLRLFVAYALKGIVILICLLLIILLVCGCLYVREHLFQTLGDGQSSISYRFDDALSNSAKDSADGLYTGKPPPIEPTIPANSADDLPDSMVIVLDAGHGGIQAGCEFDGVLEKDITLAVTLLARDKLKDMGMTVIMIREEDIDVLFLIFCLLISLLSGCGTAQNSGDDEIQDNPFDYEGPSEILGSISHKGNWPEREESKPMEYNGGEIAVPYCAKGDGTGKNVGFLLFIDGIPQPYKLNGDGEYGYMHPFSLKEDNVEEQFTFNFVPVTGKAGDTLTFTVANIFNAGFEPDMINSSNFGLYGNALSTINFIHFSADPETGRQDAPPLKALSDVTVTNELMTAQFVEENLGPQIGMTTGDGKTREDKLDESVFMFDTYDGEPELNDLDVTGKDTLHVAVDLCGIPGLTYRVAFFADNAPLSDGENCYWEITLEKGKVARVEADLELSVLEGVTTFYAIACAGEGEDDSTQGLGLIKTGSLPIWSQNKLDAGEPQNDEDQTESSTPASEVTDTPETMDENVRSLWYGQGDTVLVRKSDTLCLVDMTTGKVLAEGSVPDLKNITYHPVDGGFCAVGDETEASDGTSALMQAGSSETATICVFLDSTLSETDRFSLSALAGEDKNIMCTAISPDGRYAAFSIMNDGIYLYSRDTDKVTLLRDLTSSHRAENSGITMATGLWFNEDTSKLVFADNAHFGSVGLDGKNFVCAGFDSFYRPITGQGASTDWSFPVPRRECQAGTLPLPLYSGRYPALSI